MLSRVPFFALAARPLTISQHTLLRQPIRYSSSNPSNPFQSHPSPPRLPPEQQAEFERLQRTANTQEGFNPSSMPPSFSSANPATAGGSSAIDGRTAATPVLGNESLLPVPLRNGAPPEFEGDVNPKTGEVGGPKNEPLRWGPSGDYSFNGRVTDF
ncbi:hypothetical protein AAE478_006350 [Parahypoxylon ruwenzoriense]